MIANQLEVAKQTRPLLKPILWRSSKGNSTGNAADINARNVFKILHWNFQLNIPGAIDVMQRSILLTSVIIEKRLYM